MRLVARFAELWRRELMDDELKGDLGDDDLDASLRRTLGRAPGSMDPTAEAWEQLTPRLRHARRRNR